MPKSKNCWQAKTTRFQQQNDLKEQQAYIDTVLAGKTADTAGADDAAVLKELKAQYPEAEKSLSDAAWLGIKRKQRLFPNSLKAKKTQNRRQIHMTISSLSLSNWSSHYLPKITSGCRRGYASVMRVR